VLTAGEGQVANDVEAVPATCGPSRDDADDDLGHEPDQPVHFHDVPAPAARRVDIPGRFTVGIPVPVPPADALIASRPERPAAVPGRRPVSGQQHASDIARHPGVVQGAVQFVDRVGAEGVADLGPVEGDADGA